MKDTTFSWGAVWERSSFTVPASTSEERVQASSYKYLRRAGDAFEKQGFRVLKVRGPELDKMTVDVPPDRRRYVMWFLVTRRPKEVHIEVPDASVMEMLSTGMKLA